MTNPNLEHPPVEPPAKGKQGGWPIFGCGLGLLLLLAAVILGIFGSWQALGVIGVLIVAGAALLIWSLIRRGRRGA